MKKLTIQWFSADVLKMPKYNMEMNVLTALRTEKISTSGVAIVTDHPHGVYTGKVQFIGTEESLRPIADQFADEELGEKVEDI